MSVDKKVQAGKLRLILLEAIGTAVVTGHFDIAALQQTIETRREAV
jgi:3-dehydroquinate synthase